MSEVKLRTEDGRTEAGRNSCCWPVKARLQGILEASLDALITIDHCGMHRRVQSRGGEDLRRDKRGCVRPASLQPDHPS